MVLKNEYAELFYKLFFSLLDYANRKHNINPGVEKMRTAWENKKPYQPSETKELES